MDDLFRNAMDGILQKVAMQEIRKVVRSKVPEKKKLDLIVGIVHSYEDEAEDAELAAERRAIAEDEARFHREKVDDLFDDMAAPLNSVTIRAEDVE